ncbi:XRE family transcriptional regulator [Kineosporia sp. R_H_3]|uniref:XRE family transcriptional regulator n=1 Tax=Kineosporia sp. R_H_3 TaxID=1961848 RepID=UPI0018E9E52A|nr:XRE family transcriptional regulator [Kineosporia sp. R_H_3]
MNESRTRNSALRKAIVDARLSARDVAERLGVDPKTVQRWLAGRVPQSAHRRDLARLVGRHEYDLWPAEAGGCPISPELWCTYPNRGAVPRAVWVELFGSAAREIDVLAYSALFLFDDRELLRLIRERAESGARVRLALGDPAAQAVAQRGIDERIGSAMPAKVRNSLVLSEGLRGASNVEVRLHDTVLYASVYRGDDAMLVNPHVYGVPAASSPVLRLAGYGDLSAVYRDSFERVWDRAGLIGAAEACRTDRTPSILESSTT